jgi:hypothetical protein
MTNILVASYINTKGAKKNAISRAVRAMQGETTLRIESADVVTAATVSFLAPYRAPRRSRLFCRSVQFLTTRIE